MRCYFLFIFLFFCMPLFGQYQGIPMTGSNIKPTQIRWTRDIGTDSIFIMATDTTTGKPFWLSAKKSTLLQGGGGDSIECGLPYFVDDPGDGGMYLSCDSTDVTFSRFFESSGGIDFDVINSKYVKVINTAPDIAVTISAGTGISVSGTYPTYTVTNTAPNVNQTLSLLAGGGTLKLTKSGASSDFVQLKDSTITNEGVLSLTAPSGGIAYLNSNTSTSPAIAFVEGAGIELVDGGSNILVITSNAVNQILEAKKSDRLGIVVVSDSVGYDYKKLVKEDYPDSLDLISMFDSSSNTNKKIDLKYLDYDPYGGSRSISDFNLSLVSGVDSTVRLENEISYLFNYSQITGELQYVGSKVLVCKIDAGIDFIAGSITPLAFTFSLKHSKYGTYSVIGESVARSHYSQSTNLAVMKMNTSRLVQIDPGDKFKITLKADANNTATIMAGFMNIHFISRHIQY